MSMSSLPGLLFTWSLGSGTTTAAAAAAARGRHFRFALGRRVTGAFLAPDVLAGGADSVGPERGLAPVTGATDSHADRLAHALHGHVAGRFPLSRFEGETILGE